MPCVDYCAIKLFLGARSVSYVAGDLHGPGMVIFQPCGQNKVGEVSGPNEEETGSYSSQTQTANVLLDVVFSVAPVSLEDSQGG